MADGGGRDPEPVDSGGPRRYEFEPSDPDDPYDMEFATTLSRWVFVGFVAFGLMAGAVLWLRLPS